MGWFDGIFGGGSAGRGDGEADPMAQLDPKLREFLQKESPLKYQSHADQEKREKQAKEERYVTTAPTAPAPPPSQASSTAAASAASSASAAPAVPAESLFQDGRYADLWKTYRPLAAVEADTKSDHERLMDVLDAYKDRRAQIGRAALENCALEQIEWNECIKSGPLASRITMCHAEMKKFERCYNVQSRLLKGLGYLSAYGRSPETDERIQLHADTLYHRMLDQETAIEQAKAEGRPVPALDLSSPSLKPTTAPTTPQPSVAAMPEIPDELRKQWDERLAKLPEAERPGEEAALRAELQIHNEMTSRVTELRAAQAAEREQRKAEGKTTIKDRVSALFGQ